MNPSKNKGKPKTKIFACLCPCSVFEYVDSNTGLRKKPVGEMRGFDVDLVARSPCADAGPKPGYQAGRGPPSPQQGRGFQPTKGGDGNMLKKPLKIVMEEIDCSKLDFSHCCQPCPSPPCSQPSPCPPPPCNQQSQNQRSQNQQQSQSNNCCRPCCQPQQQQQCYPALCPLPPCPPDPCAGKQDRAPPDQKNCSPPRPEVKSRFEMKLDQSGKLMDQCAPYGSPSILNVEKDESCATETVITIKYCAKGTEKGAEKDDEGKGGKKKGKDKDQGEADGEKTDDEKRPKGEDRHKKKHSSKGSDDDETPGGEEKRASTESGDEKQSKSPKKGEKKTSKAGSQQVSVLTAMGSCSSSSLEQMFAMQSTKALMQQLARKSCNLDIRADEFEGLPSPSELSKLCATPRTSIDSNVRKVLRPRLNDAKFFKTLAARRSDPISNVVGKSRLTPQIPTKGPVHMLLGHSSGSAVQLRRRDMRVLCTSSIKHEVRPSIGRRKFKETRV